MNIRLVITALLFIFPLVATAEAITGKVVGVHDGDTLTLLVTADGHKSTDKIRLAEIDAPELHQPWGKKSKQALSALTFQKTVTAKVLSTDRYGRKVADIYADGRWVNEAMVAQGDAWVYRKYNRSQSMLLHEKTARKQRLGLWALPAKDQVPPWEWRHGGKPSLIKLGNSTSSDSFECGRKSTCKQMRSCEEATFYLDKCGVRKLDRDHDGIPCESLCK